MAGSTARYRRTPRTVHVSPQKGDGSTAISANHRFSSIEATNAVSHYAQRRASFRPAGTKNLKPTGALCAFRQFPVQTANLRTTSRKLLGPAACGLLCAGLLACVSLLIISTITRGVVVEHARAFLSVVSVLIYFFYCSSHSTCRMGPSSGFAGSISLTSLQIKVAFEQNAIMANSQLLEEKNYVSG